MPVFLLYVIIEFAAVVALASALGLGWTLLLLAATFFVGIALAGSQIKRQARSLRSGRLTTPQGAVTDSALVALGTVLVVIPGIVTTAVGVLLLLPPTRAVARPVVTALAARSIARRAGLITVIPAAAAAAAGRRAASGDYIDGEVIDSEIVDDFPKAGPGSVPVPRKAD